MVPESNNEIRKRSDPLTHLHSEQPKQGPVDYGNILLTKAFSGKHLKGKWLSEATQQFSIKYFCGLFA